MRQKKFKQKDMLKKEFSFAIISRFNVNTPNTNQEHIIISKLLGRNYRFNII